MVTSLMTERRPSSSSCAASVWPWAGSPVLPPVDSW